MELAAYRKELYVKRPSKKRTFIRVLVATTLPLGVLLVSLVTQHILDVLGIHNQQSKAGWLKDVDYRLPIYSRAFHCHMGYTQFQQPFFSVLSKILSSIRTHGFDALFQSPRLWLRLPSCVHPVRNTCQRPGQIQFSYPLRSHFGSWPKLRK